MNMKNNYYLGSSFNNNYDGYNYNGCNNYNNQMSSVVSLDLDSSWAARTWDLSNWYLPDTSKLKLQNKAVELKKEDDKTGRVRQLFQERRGGAGRDRSYPLEPLKHRVRSLDRLSNYNNQAGSRSDPTVTGDRQTRSHKVRSQTRLVDNLNNKKLTNLKETDKMEKRMTVRKENPTSIPTLTKTMRGVNLKSTVREPQEILKTDPKSKLDKGIPRPLSRPSSGVKASIPTLRPASSTLSKPKPNPIASPNKIPTDSQPQPLKPLSQNSNKTIKKILPTAQKQPINNSPSKVVPKIKSFEPDGSGRVPCNICGRPFMPDRLEVHEKICSKSKTKKRKPFDPVKHRLEGTEAESYIKTIKTKKPEKVSPPKSNWRKKHEEFITNIRAAKVAQEHLAKGGKLSDLPPPPPSDTSDYTQCPHCNRKFNQSAAERHIPLCANMKHNKPKPGAGRAPVSKRF